MSTNFESIKWIDPATISGANKPGNMPLGLISFKLRVTNVGASTQVTIYFSQPAPSGAKWYKYDPINGWQVYQHAVFSDDGTSVTVELKDGDEEYGDFDGTENGIIVDPSGFGLPSFPKKAYGGEGSGCFITSMD